ncbi:hypothetical protein WA158_000619 [Blastocystis sp. Blastoise]
MVKEMVLFGIGKFNRLKEDISVYEELMKDVVTNLDQDDCIESKSKLAGDISFFDDFPRDNIENNYRNKRKYSDECDEDMDSIRFTNNGPIFQISKSVLDSLKGSFIEEQHEEEKITNDGSIYLDYPGKDVFIYYLLDYLNGKKVDYDQFSYEEQLELLNLFEYCCLVIPIELIDCSERRDTKKKQYKNEDEVSLIINGNKNDIIKEYLVKNGLWNVYVKNYDNGFIHYHNIEDSLYIDKKYEYIDYITEYVNKKNKIIDINKDILEKEMIELFGDQGREEIRETMLFRLFKQSTIINRKIISSLVDSSANWKYSTTVDSYSWKENKIDEFGEDYNNKEIKNAGVTTYFRKDITIDDSFAVLQLSIQSKSGFIVYVNGIQVYTYLLPESSKINENTPSQSLEDIPTYKHIIVPKKLFGSSTSLTTLKIAIELHTTADHPELLSSFDVLSYITNSKDSMDTLSMLASRRLQDIPTYTMNAFEENQSIDFSTILSLSLSNCVLSTDLPTGLTLSSNCILSGTPKEVKSAEYTLSYNYGESSSNTYIFNLQILCNRSSCSHIRVHRSTTYYASYETVIVRSEDGNEIDTIVQNNYLYKDYDYYGPVGTWSFELIEVVKSIWYTGSTMTVKVIDDLSSTSALVT